MTDAAQKLVSLSDVTEDELLDCAKQHLQRGGVVAVPTDTIYGVAALAQNTKGIRQLYTIKERDRQKPIAICVGDVEDIEKYVGCSPSWPAVGCQTDMSRTSQMG